MTFQTALQKVCTAALLANALAASAAAAEQHNFIVLMPETMQTANVNETVTPALARLREEGVFFSNSFSGFPDFNSDSAPSSAAGRATELVATAAETCVAVMMDDSGAEPAAIEQTIERLKNGNRPFILIYRMRALDTQALAPAKSLASKNPGGEGAAGTVLVNTDRALERIEGKLKDLDLFDTTNIVVVAEHGRSTVWKQSKTSFTRDMHFDSVPEGNLPPGFLAIDLIKAMLHDDAGLSLYDPMQGNVRVHWWEGKYPSSGDAVISVLSTKPHVTIEARGGFDLIYLPEELHGAELVRRGRFIIEQLSRQDYVSGIFVNEERLGQMDGALSLKHLNPGADDGEPLPDILVSFTSSVMLCGHPTICAVSIADTPVQEGQDMATGFSRAETSSFMAARGPDFRTGFNSRTPASPADMMRTIAALTGCRDSVSSQSEVRELREALNGPKGAREPQVRTRVVRSEPSREDGGVVEVHLVSVDGVDYLKAAGAPGRSVGVPAKPQPEDWGLHWPRKGRFSIKIEP